MISQVEGHLLLFLNFRNLPMVGSCRWAFSRAVLLIALPPATMDTSSRSKRRVPRPTADTQVVSPFFSALNPTNSAVISAGKIPSVSTTFHTRQGPLASASLFECPGLYLIANEKFASSDTSMTRGVQFGRRHHIC